MLRRRGPNNATDTTSDSSDRCGCGTLVDQHLHSNGCTNQDNYQHCGNPVCMYLVTTIAWVVLGWTNDWNSQVTGNKPMLSEESVNKLVCDQLQIIKDLRAENAALTEIVLKNAGLYPASTEEQTIITQIPDAIQSIGKVPWYMRQAQLERAHRKPKLAELIGAEIPEQTELDFAD